MVILALFPLIILKRNTENKLENFRLINTVNRLSDEVDSLTKQVYNLVQQQKDMLEQIRRLKEMNNDGSGK